MAVNPGDRGITSVGRPVQVGPVEMNYGAICSIRDEYDVRKSI